MTRLPRVALACLALALGGGFIAACGDDDESPSAGEDPAPAATEATKTAGTEEASPSAEQVVVTMKGNSNMPAEITVKVDQPIVWENEDGYAHNVTSDDGASENIESGNFTDRFEYAPKTAGSIPYVCTIHSGQTGKITVE